VTGITLIAGGIGVVVVISGRRAVGALLRTATRRLTLEKQPARAEDMPAYLRVAYPQNRAFDPIA